MEVFHENVHCGSTVENLLCPGQVAQWLERWLVDQRVEGSIHSQRHVPQLQAQSPTLWTQSGQVREATNPCVSHRCFSLFPSSPLPSLPLSLKKEKKSYFIGLNYMPKNQMILGTIKSVKTKQDTKL